MVLTPDENQIITTLRIRFPDERNAIVLATNKIPNTKKILCSP